MLNHSGLPAIFWCHAAEYATYIYNCLPTETAAGYVSPIQARYGLIPDVSRLRRFGCICYCHIPAETRDKGFVDKAYKCYFLGVHHATQAYIVWVIDLNVERVSPNVLFDEVTPIKIQLSSLTVPVAPERRNLKDFTYLIGLVYRDDEDKLLYVTKRVVVQRGDIVAFRCVYLHNVVGQEEPRPIHVADVECMLNAYLIDNTPGVLFLPMMSAQRKLKSCADSTVAEHSTSGRALVDLAEHPESSAEQTGVDLLEEKSVM